ncbi:MAG: hypothetical protein AUJ85_08250 [Elusimicrobia bacterium CG1_02_37_114]|nr:MAG: hypothetical protein AUJ85_08250 [Elusimicrobia bacterium CG1_02_37_114]PIV52342.1 MAG: PIN domain nuclease [Elusimicrobia bacterium CG02_land_8_20_14_3_00_37_13]PIZ12592.1 MAG: PIN domain nuclease [Elusimicrobia bacterium CG_4_10_14_0_8_um_filter_37_32]
MKLKIYLDSSVPSAYFDENKPSRQKLTINWWDNVMFKDFEVYTSQVTIAEINGTSDTNLRGRLLRLIKSIRVLEVPEEAQELAKKYIDEDIIPEDYLDDALHIAIAILYQIDILVSWNFKHLVNPVTRRGINAINMLKGYKQVDIVSPEELGGDKYE